MPRIWVLVFLAALLVAPVTVQGDMYTREEEFFSPRNAETFYQIAYESYGPREPSQDEIQEALILMTAVRALNEHARYMVADAIKLVTKVTDEDQSQMIYRLLANYLGDSADIGVIKTAIRYQLANLNTREDREQFLFIMLQESGNKNTALNSELATELGLLMVERADLQNAVSLLMRAYNLNRYNNLAFDKIYELMPESIAPGIQAEHLRLKLRQNRLSMETALEFATTLNRLRMYEFSTEAYQYSVDLYENLYPGEKLPRWLYRLWAVSNYNTLRNLYKCQLIADKLRQEGGFDIVVEAISAKAAAKSGNKTEANRILKAAAEKAENMFVENNSRQKIDPTELAWFYSFGLPDATKALNWANKANVANPDSEIVKALMAHALVKNNQGELAKSFISVTPNNQIAALVDGLIKLSEGQTQEAIEVLKAGMELDSGSLEAEVIEDVLEKNNSQYIPATDPVLVERTLRGEFGEGIVPEFKTADKLFKVKLDIRGTKFAYEQDIKGSLVISNISAEQMVISNNSLFKGNIRVDAVVSGDINAEIPNLTSEKIEPSLPIESGKVISVPLHLITGRLRQILFNHPQANLNVDFIVYLDPVINPDGTIRNALADIEPVRINIQRNNVEISQKYLQTRLNALSSGQMAQKLISARLFVGLLIEQEAMAGKKPMYKYVRVEPLLLNSAVAVALADDDWSVKVQTMAALLNLTLDYKLISAVSGNLSDRRWPVRLMSLYLLGKSQSGNYKDVLDWIVQFDTYNLVINMATVLGGEKPEKEPEKEPGEESEEEETQSSPDSIPQEPDKEDGV